jgi:hypothetical protein
MGNTSTENPLGRCERTTRIVGLRRQSPLGRGPGNPNTIYLGTTKLRRSTNKGATDTVASQTSTGRQRELVPESGRGQAAGVRKTEAKDDNQRTLCSQVRVD